MINMTNPEHDSPQHDYSPHDYQSSLSKPRSERKYPREALERSSVEKSFIERMKTGNEREHQLQSERLDVIVSADVHFSHSHRFPAIMPAVILSLSPPLVSALASSHHQLFLFSICKPKYNDTKCSYLKNNFTQHFFPVRSLLETLIDYTINELFTNHNM